MELREEYAAFPVLAGYWVTLSISRRNYAKKTRNQYGLGFHRFPDLVPDIMQILHHLPFLRGPESLGISKRLAYSKELPMPLINHTNQTTLTEFSFYRSNSGRHDICTTTNVRHCPHVNNDSRQCIQTLIVN